MAPGCLPQQPPHTRTAPGRLSWDFKGRKLPWDSFWKAPSQRQPVRGEDGDQSGAILRFQGLLSAERRVWGALRLSGALPSESGVCLTLVTGLPPGITGTPSYCQGPAAAVFLSLRPGPVALALVFSGLPRPSPALEKEEQLSVQPAWSLRPRKGQAAGQAPINLFLLGRTRQLPEWGRDLWADLLMIYYLVLRPGTRGTSLSRPVWRIFSAGIRAGEVGD